MRKQRGVKAPRGGSEFTDPPSTPLVDPPRPPPCSHMGGQGVWCACRGGSRPPEGGLSTQTPPSTPLVDPPRPLHHCTSYRLIEGGVWQRTRGGSRPPEASDAPTDRDIITVKSPAEAHRHRAHLFAAPRSTTSGRRAWQSRGAWREGSLCVASRLAPEHSTPVQKAN